MEIIVIQYRQKMLREFGELNTSINLSYIIAYSNIYLCIPRNIIFLFFIIINIHEILICINFYRIFTMWLYKTLPIIRWNIIFNSIPMTVLRLLRRKIKLELAEISNNIIWLEQVVFLFKNGHTVLNIFKVLEKVRLILSIPDKSRYVGRFYMFVEWLVGTKNYRGHRISSWSEG